MHCSMLSPAQDMVHGAGSEVYTDNALVIVEYIQELLHLLNVRSELM